MPDISTLLSPGPPAATAAPRSQILRGQIAKAPATAAEPLSVISMSLSYWQDYIVAPGHWIQVGALPKQGAECLILLDEEGDAHVPIYSGTGGSDDCCCDLDGGHPDSIYGGVNCKVDGGVLP